MWMFCSKVANNEIHKTHKRALSMLYGDDDSTFQQMLDKDRTTTIHKKNEASLMVEIYKSMNQINPEFMWEYFVKRDIPYNLRRKELCKLP